MVRGGEEEVERRRNSEREEKKQERGRKSGENCFRPNTIKQVKQSEDKKKRK